MPAPQQAAIDDRGYFFSLPTLGMPDPAGEWVPLKAAIAPLEMNSCLKLEFESPATSTAPLRTPPTINCTTKLIEYQNALWVLPKVPPQRAPSHTPEFFTVKVWRKPLPAKPDLKATKIDNDEKLVCLAGTTDWQFFGRGSGPRTAEELDFHVKAMAIGCRNVDPPSSGPRQPTAAELDIEREFTKEELDGNIFTPEWCEEIDLFKGTPAGTGRKKQTHVQMRVHPQEHGDFRGMDYVLRAEGDFSPPRDDEWKPMPARATLPGVQRCWVNMSRWSMGRGPLPPPPSSSKSYGGSSAA